MRNFDRRTNKYTSRTNNMSELLVKVNQQKESDTDLKPPISALGTYAKGLVVAPSRFP